MARSALERRFLIILSCLLILTGCRDKNEQQADVEAAEATTAISKLKSELKKTKRNLADANEELLAIKDIRDELDKQVAQMTAERDNAVKAAAVAEQKIKELKIY